MRRRVVITGLGAVTPIGNNVKEFWQGIREGRCGIAPITYYDTSQQKVKLAGEVKNFEPEKVIEKKELRRMDRFTQFAQVAAAEAMEDSGIDLEKVDRSRFGVLVASGIGGLNAIQNEDRRGSEKGYDRVLPYFIPMCISNMAAGHIAIRYGLMGMCSCVVTACAGGTNAVGDAYRHIKDDYADMMICGGTESCITNLGIGGFTAMQALSLSEDPVRASIPFDKERNGFVMAEGSAMLVLEEYEHAKSRNAHIYCELAGYGTNCDAYHVTAPREDGKGAADCMRMALADAGAAPEDINYINAHGTSTKLNDKSETKAIRTIFGSYADRIAVSSTKSMTGHMIAATGAAEAVITALSIEQGYIPATINYRVPDEECDLDVVPNKGREQSIGAAMSNSLGFGGHNACIVMKHI